MPPDVKPQIIVVIRFSYVALSGFRLSRNGEQDVRALLYASDRLERRFRMFEALTLPSLLAQTDPDFTTAVLVGADFPHPWKKRLEALLRPLADARIISLPPLSNFKATKKALDRCTSSKASHVVSMRLDDDDAISNDCIAETRRTIPPLLQISGAENPAIIAFNCGLFLEQRAAGNTLYGVNEKTPLGIGMSMVAPRGARPTIFSTDHRMVHTRWNCFTDGMTPRFIRTVHADNDSSGFMSGTRVEHSDDELDAILAQRFPFSRQALMTLGS
ncbi:glycosyltransferase [Roseinatronobacter alkalisoli]|uniref:Glycosyltransferase n=1 Tax=Roseinatronobacter alkalisoli TaxID=3028235 RepID=A0ABT5TAK0_9RHOB|nr:glycosyltransferase [Roseinatronobacter sp. HJB301]MDD7972143.1 glycosyltransferase [Roseinatronobacter sp. HJB301]